MKQNIIIFMTSVLFIVPTIFANEFVVKKTKTKKEIAVHVKEDIIELLESSLRQLGRNIQQSVAVQNHIFDMIKNVCDDGQQSTAQLKELRDRLEKYLKKIEEQQVDLQSFILQSK